MNDQIRQLSDRVRRIDQMLAPIRERLDLDWAAWNEEHRGGAGGSNPRGPAVDSETFEDRSGDTKEAKAALKFKLGKLTAEFDAAKHEGKEGTMIRVTQQIADKIGGVYRKGGDTPSACASVIGWPGVSAIGKACTAKAEREYANDPVVLTSRQKAAEEVAAEAVANGDAKKVASSMIIAHTYRTLSAKHSGQRAAAAPGRVAPRATPAQVARGTAAATRAGWPRPDTRPR